MFALPEQKIFHRKTKQNNSRSLNIKPTLISLLSGFIEDYYEYYKSGFPADVVLYKFCLFDAVFRLHSTYFGPKSSRVSRILAHTMYLTS